VNCAKKRSDIVSLMDRCQWTLVRAILTFQDLTARCFVRRGLLCSSDPFRFRRIVQSMFFCRMSLRLCFPLLGPISDALIYRSRFVCPSLSNETFDIRTPFFDGLHSSPTTVSALSNRCTQLGHSITTLLSLPTLRQSCACAPCCEFAFVC